MRSISVLLGVLVLAGCQHAAPQPEAATVPQPAPAVAAQVPHYSIVGSVPQAGVRTLHGGETVTSVLHDVLPEVCGGSQATVTLIRRGPEGMTRELIDFDSTGHLVNPAQNYVLRDGDELVLPSKSACPAGLQRPRIARISSCG